jgi:hypothetical protein
MERLTFVVKPMQAIHKELSVLKKNRISLDHICMEGTGIVIDDNLRSYN